MPWVRIKTVKQMKESGFFDDENGYLKVKNSHVVFNKPMQEHCGKLVYMREVSNHNRIFFLDGETWNFTPEMLEVITSVDQLTDEERKYVSSWRTKS